MSFSDYEKWFLKTIQCQSLFCKEYLYHNYGFICNYNISKYKENEYNSPVRPQAGYIDEEWFNKKTRILILGLNPRDGYKSHDELYRIYDQIIENQKLTIDNLKKIQEIVDDYWVLTLLKEGIKEMFPYAAFGYTNQLLCRTNPEASKINLKQGIGDVYKECFSKNVFELVKITCPTKIIAVGKKWEEYFNGVMKEIDYPPNNFICAYHPSYGRKKKALAQIKGLLEGSNK